MNLQEAAEQALKHLESVSDWDTTYPIGKAKEALRQALTQPVDLAKVGEVGVWGEKPPTKRDNLSWVGLTDEEIYDYADKFLYQHGSNYGIRSFGKAIEAKLKEKNSCE